MKAIIKIIIFGSVVFSISSCKKTFLDTVNPNSVTAASFYKTESDFQKAIIGAYYPLQGLVGDGSQNSSNSVGAWAMGEMRSDNTDFVYNTNDRGALQLEQIAYFSDDARNNHTSLKWNQCYKVIAFANPVLQYIEGASINDSVKKVIKGEALFLRSYAFFELIQYFGDVPFPLADATSLETTALARTPTADIYARIIADTKLAASLLPSKKVQTPGHVQSGTANMLLGYIYMTQKKYPEAEAALKLVDNGDYTLMSKYSDVFDPKFKNNSESLLEVQFQAISGYNSNFTYFFVPRLQDASVIPGFPAGAQTLLYGGWNVPTASLLAEYEAADSLRYKTNISDVPYKDVNGVTVKHWCKKYLHPHSINFVTDEDWILYRYADAILLLAEALNEQGKTPEAIAQVKRVRRRAGLLDASFTAVTQDAVRKAIAHERRVELAFENKRWLDLVRTGQAVPVMTAFGQALKADGAHTYLLSTDYNVTATRLLFPIPQSEININPKVTQNPGYN
jgi:starch-binding outer membrane protein, SusD/RagB family